VCARVVDALFVHGLRRRDADTRLAGVRVCAHLFTRMHAFRTLITDRIDEWMLLTVGDDLPPPSAHADALRAEATV
jgi:hypothetical protein